MGYVGIEHDYPVSIKEVLDITAETGALETQCRVRKLKPFTDTTKNILEDIIEMIEELRKDKNEEYANSLDAQSAIRDVLDEIKMYCVESYEI